ncbi:hydrocephalus-inducing protein homolog, partial [Onychostruthus taczanowskii]|uniref:hydrocephalus-inducing protein homolog n=1 Tax=Onychostruthus taczanowskii TaxID=356909 RepID=UPI001B7FFB61
LTPSAFQKEISLSTKERLAIAKKLSLPQIVQPQDKRESSHHKFLSADPEQRSFQPCPPEVVFQKYTPGEVYEVPVVLRNRDKVPHLVKVTLESSPYFQLVGPNAVCRKVPPGLYTSVRVLFTPGQNKDYFHELLCTTEREEFIVPIWAVPFSVVPAMGTLDVSYAMNVAVEFQPLQTGDHSGSLVVRYDTGEETHTSLHGRAVDVPIRLDKNTVSLEKTYITMSSRATVLIHNQSNITARFQWKAVGTQGEEDQLEMMQYPRIFQEQKKKVYDLLKKSRAGVICQERLDLLTHSFQSEVAKIREDAMLFCDDVFSLEPKEGEIRPNCSAEISVFFKPQKARVYKRTVYCDISGREKRMPLLLTGEGLGPRLHFHFEELDIGEVFVRLTHTYEVVLFNNGPIKAPFKLIPPSSAMGSCFTFLPQEGIVAPSSLQAIQVSFCPTILGEFEEEFSFHVTESPEPVTLTVRGYVIGPTFHFDVSALDFGDISFGFPRTLNCCLFNTSLTPIDFHLYIPGDGLGEPSVDSSTQILRCSSQSWRKEVRGLRRPREFDISPCRGTVRALGSQDIKVTLCSNTVGEYKLWLVLDVDDVGEKVLALPLTARCIVPPLRVLNPVLDLYYCFLKTRYDEKLTLVNDSDFPGCYCVLPQEHREEAAVWYSSSAPSGIIEAHSSVQIPIAFEPQLLGECNITAEIAVFGRAGSPLAGKCSCWRIEPSKGVVPPKREMSVAVIANLNDTVKFQEEVKVFIDNTYMTIISLQAVGTGTTIVTDKPLMPKLDLKSQFSFTPCYFHFKITNRGRRVHRLYWSTEGFHMFGHRTRARALGGTKSKGASPVPRPGSPVFKMRPPQADLRPGQSVDMVLEGCSSTAQEVKERLLCHAVVGKDIAKKQIMQVDVICNFICPALQMSSRAITFHVEKKPSDVLVRQYKPLTLKNTSSLPFRIVLDLKQPFLICNVDRQPFPAHSKPITLDAGEELHLYIQFNPAYKKNLNSWVAKRVLRVRFMEHPRKEKITVRGEVCFPNLRLQAKAVDFGCIINDTEQVLYMEMTNCSPLPVEYHWSFLTDSPVNTIKRTLTERILLKRTLSRSHQMYSAQEVSYEEDPAREDPAQEDPAQEDSAQEDSEQEPSDAEDSLKTEVLSSTPGESQSLVRMRGLSQFSEMEHPNVGMLEVFGVLPLWGVLQPGQKEQVTFTFFGYANIIARATALCRVKGGPTYEVVLTGQASCPSYQLVVEEIDWGLQMFNKVLKAEITLRNTGVMKFTYVVPNSSTGTAAKPLPGVPVVVPRRMFNKVLKAEITLRNTGVMKFTYVVPNSSTGTAAKPLPGVPVVVPRRIAVESGVWL